MTTVAKNLFLARIASDGVLSQKEFQGLLDLVFDAKDSFAQVDLATYALVDRFIDGDADNEGLIKTGKVTFSADDPFTSGTDEDNKHILHYLGSGFPGSLASFRSRLHRYFGITLPAFDTPLPELTPTRFTRDAKNPALYHFSARVTGTAPDTGEAYAQDHSFDYDTSKPWAEQAFYTSGDPVKKAAAADIMDCLAAELNLPQAERKFLTPEKTTLFEEFNLKTTGFPNNGRDLTAIMKAQAELVGPECDLINNHSEPFPAAQRLADAPSPIPAYGDGTGPTLELRAAYDEARRIVDDGVLSFLTENGVTIGFYDFDGLSRQMQVKTAAQGHAEHDLLGDGPAGLFDPKSKKIFIDTGQNPDFTVIAIVHEMGHAVNQLIQRRNSEIETYVVTNPMNGTTQEMTGHEFTGTQKSIFLDNSYVMDEKMSGWDSQYAASNEAEWFAEKFLYVMLERGGRLDLLKHLPDHNPLLELSPLLVDGQEYLLMRKIVQTLDEAAAKPENLRLLVERGIDDALWESCWQNAVYYDVWHDGDKTGGKLGTIRAQLKAGKTSSHLNNIQWDWAGQNLTDLYAATPSEDIFQDDFYREEIKTLWERRNDAEIRAGFMPDGDGSYAMQWLADRLPDMKAVHVATQIERTDLSLEAKGKILFENGIADEASLGFFCQGLTSLEPEQVKPVLGKPELLAAASAYAAQDFMEASYLAQYYETEIEKAYQNLGGLRPDAALAPLERFVQVNPGDVRPWAYLAAAYAALERQEDARIALEKAAALAQGYDETEQQIHETYTELAESYVAAGKFQEAIVLYEITRPFTTDSAALAEKIRVLKKSARRPESRPTAPTKSDLAPAAETAPKKSGELSDEDLRKLITGE